MVLPYSRMASLKVDSRLGQVLSPALERIIKNASWPKHAKLIHQCKTILVWFNYNQSSQLEINSSRFGILHDNGAIEYTLFDFEFIIGLIIIAISSGILNIDYVYKLIAYGYLHGKTNTSGVIEANYRQNSSNLCANAKIMAMIK